MPDPNPCPWSTANFCMLLGIALALPAFATDLTLQPSEQQRLDRDSRQRLEQIQQRSADADPAPSPGDGQSRRQLERVLPTEPQPRETRPRAAGREPSPSPGDDQARRQLDRAQQGEQARLQERQHREQLMRGRHREIAPQPYWRERHEGIMRQRGFETQQQRQLRDFRGQQQRFNWQRR
jgi:hypothetical protein